ncbi:DUF805 domain-containing protein [Demequina flava]|uniref:DUF805 domain-containing protein n=1 Tax=Demequina flava TaxID=1095025 RepID=UPI000780A873|nr:DUF805 domain-containing protein [Demequina flava]
MGLGDAIAVCLRKYGDFSGRARRSEFWWFFFAVQLFVIPVMFIGVFIMSSAFVPLVEQMAPDGTLPAGATGDINWLPFYLGLALMAAVFLGLLFPTLAATSRRLHDVGLSAAWLWLYVIGLGIVPLIMCVFEGEAGENDHGPDPRAAVS